MRNTVLLWGIVTMLLLTGCAVEQPPKPLTVTPTSGKQSAPAPKPHATGTPEDARRHMVRGMAAIEMAKSEAELTLAEDEFRMATEIAPQMANAWFNLGKAQVQLGRFSEAIANYRQYLVLAPAAEDAQRVRDEIVKLEFRQELITKSQARVGTWVAKDGTPYNLTIDGNRLTLKTNLRWVPEDEVRSTRSLRGACPVAVAVQADYQLILQGNLLTGNLNRGAVHADECTVPPDTSGVTGELRESEGVMVLHHDRMSYNASTLMALLGNDYCGQVDAIGRKTVEEIIYGPLGKGGLGVELKGLRSWWDGGFSWVQFGWQGRLGVRSVKPDTPAFAAGLRDDDEILAIDGVAVSSLSAGEAVVRLRGEPGSNVTLEIWRKGNKDPVSISIRRVEIPLTQPEIESKVDAFWIN